MHLPTSPVKIAKHGKILELTYVCRGLCLRYSTTGVVTKGHLSLYDVGFVRCSACGVVFPTEYTKLDSAGVKCCVCCGAKVRSKPRGKYKKVTPGIKVVQKIK